ncbi:MAG: hypothetical protein IPP35_04270 [Elusimicrobia bacterium]|nr:hypothetical protein [Elusimicrobiota bacterium]
MEKRRWVAVSRGNLSSIYRSLGMEYVDLSELVSGESLDGPTRDFLWNLGGRKQREFTPIEGRLIEETKSRLGLVEIDILHPSSLMNALSSSWGGGIAPEIPFEPLPRLAPESGTRLTEWPIVLHRWPANPFFPATPENVEWVRAAALGAQAFGRGQTLLCSPTFDANPDLMADEFSRVEGMTVPPQDMGDRFIQLARKARMILGSFSGLPLLGALTGTPTLCVFREEKGFFKTHRLMMERLWIANSQISVRLVNAAIQDPEKIGEGLFTPGGAWHPMALS